MKSIFLKSLIAAGAVVACHTVFAGVGVHFNATNLTGGTDRFTTCPVDVVCADAPDPLIPNGGFFPDFAYYELDNNKSSTVYQTFTRYNDLTSSYENICTVRLTATTRTSSGYPYINLSPTPAASVTNYVNSKGYACEIKAGGVVTAPADGGVVIDPAHGNWGDTVKLNFNFIKNPVPQPLNPPPPKIVPIPVAAPILKDGYHLYLLNNIIPNCAAVINKRGLNVTLTDDNHSYQGNTASLFSSEKIKFGYLHSFYQGYNNEITPIIGADDLAKAGCNGYVGVSFDPSIKGGLDFKVNLP